MKKEEILALKKNRLAILTENGKNVDSQDVVKKHKREIRKLEKEVHLICAAGPRT